MVLERANQAGTEHIPDHTLAKRPARAYLGGDTVEEYYRKVTGFRPSGMRFPDPVPTIQYESPIGPMRPTFRDRLVSEAPILKSAADRFVSFAQNHPINREPRERMERDTPHERMETPAQERYEHQRGRTRSRPTHYQSSAPFTVGSPNFEMSDFLPQNMSFGSGPTFEEMSYGKPRSKKRKRGY